MKLKGIFILGMLIFSGCAKPENISSANKNPVDDSTKAHLALISHEDGKRYVELSIPKSFLLKMPHKNLPEEAGLILTSNYHQTTGLRPIKPYQSKNIGGIKSSVVILLSPENKNTNDMAQWEKLISATPKKIYNLSVYHQKGKDNSLEILRPAQPDLRQNLIYVCNISVSPSFLCTGFTNIDISNNKSLGITYMFFPELLSQWQGLDTEIKKLIRSSIVKN